MDILRPTTDPHSFSNPEYARVLNTHLELNVDFNRNVLKGKAILTIERKPPIRTIALDIFGLTISRVTKINGTRLKYYVGKRHADGSPFYIELPQLQTVDTTYNSNFECKIQIEYETSPNSSALYWLTPAQTADGLYPFLLSNNKLIYARAWFPCQDTPSVKSTYSAKISVPKNFRVLMSALLENTFEGPQLDVYEFRQMTPVSSYAVIIAVGSLEQKKLIYRTNVFAENKYIEKCFKTFRSYIIESMLQIAESLCGPYAWGRYDVCVLPPSIAHFEIECPCVAFISPALLGGDSTSFTSLARNISQSWAGNLVTCSNYEHLWLNKSFNIFISRKIENKILIDEDMKPSLERKGLNDVNNMIEKKFENDDLLKCLIPNLTGLSLHEATVYVPYKTGCMLLDYLENTLGPSVFEQFFKSYFHEFAFKSINTQDWINYLYQYFPDKKEILDCVEWYSWFFNTTSSLFEPRMSSWETEILMEAEKWIKLSDVTIFSMNFHEIRNFSNDQKIKLLHYLHSSYESLTKFKLNLISHFCFRKIGSDEMRFLLLLLYIKIRWAYKIDSALDFAIQYCSPNYACPIFQYLYEWTEMRQTAIKTYITNKEKMLDETQEKLNEILHLNS